MWNSAVVTGGGKRMMRVRLQDLAFTALLAVIPLTGCAPLDQPSRGNLNTFSSIDEAYTAVDGILGCESDPAGEQLFLWVMASR